MHGDAGLGRHIGESSVAIVVVQDIVAVIGDIDIDKAVVVVIADGHSLGISLIPLPA